MDKLARYSPGIEQGCFDLTAHTCFIIQRQHFRLYSHSQNSELPTRILTRLQSEEKSLETHAFKL